MGLLTDDWKYPVVESDLDPSDPLVNTASEYMYQMATISFHTLHGTQTWCWLRTLSTTASCTRPELTVRRERQVLDRLRP